jgi:ATP-dependent DNA helicase RecQ
MPAMITASAADDLPLERITDEVRRYWGFDTLRPLQEQAIRASLAARDSVVVLPTGGGKSLCYQVPPLLADHLGIVVSPLISLMKDQVDGLVACGYPAAAVHSELAPAERFAIRSQIAAGELRLLFVSPERLVTTEFLDFVDKLGVRSFAIDESHCISQWGHDFRPEYRQLAVLKERFPDATVHAFTATATPRVREDIAEQLRLESPEVLVGTFDRPNLTYRVVPRVDVVAQSLEIIGRHAGEAVIIYCLSRRDTESLAAALQAAGIRAAHYHAGMERGRRRETQEAFADESLDVVVATVAFGMGIDRSNVRCVIHAAMPKSVEAYQQETGRAGRDGLEAECVLLHSGADAQRWIGLMERSLEEALVRAPQDADALEDANDASIALLRHMQQLCGGAVCRHRALSEYFGQAYDAESCGACDVCLDEIDALPGSTVTAQKIASCVARVGQRFGVGHVADVLAGADTEMVRRCGHDQLSTHGLLGHFNKKVITNLVYQLVDQGILARTPGDRPVVILTEAASEVLRGEREVRLMRPALSTRTRRSNADTASWEGVDRDLFEKLRALRKRLAEARGVPPYIVFGDATLREMASARPCTVPALLGIRGVGQRKLADFGDAFLEVIVEHADGAVPDG